MPKISFLLLISIALLVTGNAHSQITFSPYLEFETISDPKPICIGDVNNDGRNDVVLVTESAHYGNNINNFKVFVYLQNTLGTLDEPMKYDYSHVYGISSMKIADLNNDGLNDVAIAYGNKVGIFYQNVSGTLNNVVRYDCNPYHNGMNVGDFNNDGLTDIVLSKIEYADIEILQQNLEGGFTHVFYPKPADFIEVEVADLNNDGRDDLVFASTSILCTYLQNSVGSLDPYTVYTNLNIPSYQISGVGVGDLNNDGWKDIAFSKGGNQPNSKIYLCFQNPVSHIFEAPIIKEAYDIPDPIEIADLNNDGKNEIITVHGGWNKVSCYEQNSAGQYNTYTLYPIPYATTYIPQALSVGDLNNDGRKDLAITDLNHGMIVLYNVSETLAVKNFNANFPVQVYPNPTAQDLMIDCSSLGSSTVSVQLFDNTGKCVLDQVLLNTNQKLQLNLSHLHSGIYLLKLTYDQKTISQKIVKQ
jgi:hypothetical protein